MPAYHSTFQVDPQNDRFVGNFVLLPLNTTYRGPAYAANSDYDIIDECLDLFRANSFFKNFEIKSPSDRVLIYGILYINDCLNHVKGNMSYNEAVKQLTNLSLDSNGFKIPGDIGFPLNNIYNIPTDNRQNVELLRQYLQQFRQELAMRLLKRCYADPSNPGNLIDTPSKYWLGFTRRKFMNKSL
ncbi:subunit of the Arp2/3 complex [Hanseniaspora vineae]